MPTTPIRPQNPKPTVAATTQSTASTKTAKPKEDDKRYKVLLRVKIGTLEFSNLKGDFLGQPYIRLSTYQHSEFKCIIYDPDDKFRLQIAKQQDVEVELGFTDGYRRNVFVGKLYSVGRYANEGVEIVAVDPAFQMQQQTGASVQFSAEQPGTTATATTTPSNTPADSGQNLQDTQNQIEAQDFKGRQEQVKKAATGDRKTTPVVEQLTAKHPGLKFSNDSPSGTGAIGQVRLQQTEMQFATQQAGLTGDAVVTRGNTVRQVAPGQGESSGVVLDYKGNRSAFIGKPRIFKRTGLQLQSGFGSLTVMGWNPTEKTMVGATVVTPGAAPNHPTGVIQVPEWGAIKLGDPIVPGSMYTWNDATKNGTRIPTKAVMQRIAAIAQAITPLTEKTVGKGKKWDITSWYRDPAANAAAGGASQSRHLQGDAVDFYFDVNGGEQAFYRSLEPSWNGGLAIKPGSFVHIDLGARRRWTY